MTMIDSLAISLPVIFTIIGLVISFENFKLNKRKSNASEKLELLQKQKEENRRDQNIELRLTSMEKDIQYIRITVDDINGKINTHENRINSLEKDIIRRCADINKKIKEKGEMNNGI